MVGHAQYFSDMEITLSSPCVAPTCSDSHSTSTIVCSLSQESCGPLLVVVSKGSLVVLSQSHRLPCLIPAPLLGMGSSSGQLLNKSSGLSNDNANNVGKQGQQLLQALRMILLLVVQLYTCPQLVRMSSLEQQGSCQFCRL